jgi:hypothetical protein
MLPKIDLPDLLFEVHSWTGFLDAFVHLGDGTTRMKDLAASLVALLVSEACNIGLTPVVNPAHEALTRARLVHVDQFTCAPTPSSLNYELIPAGSIKPTASSHLPDLERSCPLSGVLRTDAFGQAVPVGDDGVASWTVGAANVQDERVSALAHGDLLAAEVAAPGQRLQVSGANAEPY